MKLKFIAIFLLSLPITASALEYRFDYDLNGRTKRWGNTILYQDSLPGLRVNLKGLTTSSLFSLPGLERRERNRFLGFNLFMPLRNNLSWNPFFVGTEMEVRGQGRREAKVGSGIELQQGPNLFLSLQGGGISLRRDEGSSLSGLLYGLQGRIKLPLDQKITANLKFSQRKEALSLVPKKGSNLGFQIRLKSWGVKNGVSLLDSTQERNYFLGDNLDSTGGRRERVREARFNSRISLIKGFRGDLFLFRSQAITHRRWMKEKWAKVVKELRDGFSLTLEHPWGNRYRLSLFYRYLRGQDDYEEDLRDEKLESGELGGMVSWIPSPADSLKFEGFAGLRSIKPLVQTNYDNRDEANRFLRGHIFHRLTPYLHLKVRGEMEIKRQVYIQGEKSADNNSITNYSLAPATIWRIGKWLSLWQKFRLNARYQTYDWAQSQQMDNLLRGLEAKSELSWRLSSRLNGKLNYLHRWEDYGKLKWEDEWVERLSWKRTTNQWGFSFGYLPNKGLRFAPGLSYRVEREWTPEVSPLGGGWGLSAKEKRLRLSLEGSLSLGRGGLILFRGSRRVILGGESFDYLNLNINLFY